MGPHCVLCDLAPELPELPPLRHPNVLLRSSDSENSLNSHLGACQEYKFPGPTQTPWIRILGKEPSKVGFDKPPPGRTSYIMYRAWRKMKTQGPLFKRNEESQDGNGRARRPCARHRSQAREAGSAP